MKNILAFASASLLTVSFAFANKAAPAKETVNCKEECAKNSKSETCKCGDDHSASASAAEGAKAEGAKKEEPKKI